MPRYKAGLRKKRLPSRVLWLLAGLLGLAVIGTIISQQVYNSGLGPVSKSQKTQIFTVEKGSSVKQISAKLEDDNLIRSAWAFQLYVHKKELSSKLQAGTYALSPSLGTPEIVGKLTKGRVATQLATILPGRRIDQVRADLINDGFSPASVDNALNPAQYSDLPALKYKPANVSTLEGLLWPESYQKQPDTHPSVIIRESLKATGDHMTTDVQSAFAAHGLTTYQGIILASIIMQEVNKSSDQAQAAQVFLSRLQKGMVLGSDVTANYGAITAGHVPNLSFDSPYNTLKHQGLPPTPISTINTSSLAAAANPASTDWLYFVAGDDGTTYFSHTFEEHEAAAAKYCHKLCGR